MYKYFQFVLLFYFSPPPSIYIVHQGTQSIKPCDFELNPRIKHNAPFYDSDKFNGITVNIIL